MGTGRLVIGDGALGIWNLARHYWPEAGQIVDGYPACSHLQAAAIALGEHRAGYETQQPALWHGRIQHVLDALHDVAWLPAPVAEQETYFVRHQPPTIGHRAGTSAVKRLYARLRCSL